MEKVKLKVVKGKEVGEWYDTEYKNVSVSVRI